MEKTIVKTDNYLLVVDDSEIKEGDWFYQVNLNKIIHHNLKNGLLLQPQSFDKKIIAHLPLKDTLTFEGVPLLPPIEDDDVWSMGLEARLKELPYTKHLDDGMFNDGQISGFESGAEWGYNKAREKYKFTEEDVRKAIEWVNNGNGSSLRNTEFFYPQADKFIQSLSQPNTPSYFEFETEITHEGNGTYSTDLMDIGLSNLTPIKVIKTTTNSQGQQVACGKYIY